MKYTEAKYKIANFDQIIVTGPQRSGTRIAAQIIAHDFGLPYCDEKDIHLYSKNAALKVFELEGKAVIQAPGLSCKAHLFPANVLIILMMRPVSEIQASEQRIGWDKAWIKNEWLMYEDVGFKPIVAPISVYKYLIWRKHQRPLITNYIELEYHSLRGNLQWIPRTLRTNFKFDQTEI